MRSPFLKAKKNFCSEVFESADVSHRFLHSLILPFPDFLNEVLSPQIVAAQTSFSHQLLLHHHLRGDASVVAARVPQRGLSSHPVPADSEPELIKTCRLLRTWGCVREQVQLPSGQTVLNGVGEGVTQMQGSCHVRRRDAHHEDAARVLLTDTFPLQKP